MLTIETLKNKLANGDHPFLKELYGNNHETLEAKAKSYIELVKDFQELYNHQEFELFSSPGRTEVGGNHTDHQQGRVLAGAVNMDNIAVAAPNNSQTIRIKSEGYNEIVVDISSFNVDKAKFYTSEALVKGICARMQELGYQIGGFDACIKGGVPEGSGLSSSASFEVLIGAILSHLFNNGKLDPVENAKIGQWAENNYFGKPCGLMDQTACSVGGFITIDFENPDKPVVKALDFDFAKTGYTLVITDTGGSHANLGDEYPIIPKEMKSVAEAHNKQVLRETSLDDIIASIPNIRNKVGDRALLRAIHFQKDNLRVFEQVKFLENNDFDAFLQKVIESGYSSYMYNQNVFLSSSAKDQGVALGLSLSELILKDKGAWRVHGGGFAGTIQAFVPNDLLEEYTETLEHVFGKKKCHKLFIRSKGAVKLEL